MNKAVFGQFIAENRRQQGLTQKDLAAALHVTDKAVSKWERGLSFPDVTLLEPLAAGLNLTVAELMTCRRQESAESNGVDEPMQNLLDISRDSVRKERRNAWKRIGAVLALLVITAAVVMYTQLFVSEEGERLIVLTETVNGADYVYVEGEDGHLIKLKCEADVDIDGIQLVNQVGQPQFFQMSFRYNRLTGEGSVTGLESTGDFSIELTDTSLDEGEGPLFGLYMVYRTSENYYPNSYGEGYLCDYVCWVYTNLGPFDSRDILRVEDCVTATPWDADGDGIDELVVRTRWPEKPYTVYDMVDGEVQAVSWPDTVPEGVQENLTCIWEQ